MNDFKNLDEIRRIDPQDTVGSTENLVAQLEASWKEVQGLPITEDFSKVHNIVFCGMGASIYGALVAKALEGQNFSYPSEAISDYHIPSYVNENTLVVLTSYSGTTEEVLSCTKEAVQKSAKILILTKGGALAEFAKEHQLPSYIFDGKLNPAGVPRLGVGYTILGLLGLLSKTGIISISDQDISSAIQRVKPHLAKIKRDAISDSEKLVGKIPVIFAAEHLSGNAQILRNQFNETSKTFSAYYLVPDLNHHLMEGLQFPETSKLHFLIFQSKNYSPKIQKRMELTREVVDKNKHTPHWMTLSGATIFDDFIAMLLMGSYLTLYLGLRYDQNPAINPWVDYFKKQLAK